MLTPVSRLAFLIGFYISFIASQHCTIADETNDTVVASDEGRVSYSRDIEPLFRVNCQGCHQRAKAHGDYVMTDFASLVSAGESGDAAIVPGDPDASYLVQQIAVMDGEASMPKKSKPLHASEIALIRKWIEQGAVDDSPPAAPKYDSDNPPTYSRPPVVTSLAYSPDGKWLASTGFQEVLLTDTKNWTTKHRLIGMSERIESLSFSPDSKRLAVAGGSPGKMGEIQIWDVESGKLIVSHQETGDTLYGGCFSPDGKLVAFGATDNVVRAIDAETGEQKLHQGAHDDWILSCVFNPSGTHLLSAGRDMTVKLTEVATERFVDNVTSITPGALRGGINALAMHPTRDEFVVGGADGIPKVYRIFRQTERRIGDDANLIRQFPTTGGRIFGVAVNQAGNLLAVASTLDGQSKLQVYPYDFDGTLTDEVKAIQKKRVSDRKEDEKKLLEELRSKTSPAIVDLALDATSLYSVAFSPDGKSITIGGGDGTIRLVNIESGKVIREIVPVSLSDTSGELAAATALKQGDGLDRAVLADDDVRREATLLPKSPLLDLQVTPSDVRLASPLEYTQLVISAEYEDGQVCDVTRLAEYRSSASPSHAPLQISPTGLVRLADDSNSPQGIENATGETDNTKGAEQTIEIRFADRTAVIPVRFDVAAQTAHPSVTDFIQDVNPILSRLGCNSGTCHGAQKGKNGFKLSLRGYDPVEDIRALSDDLGSRRLNTAAPDASLMLLKPIGAVPHEGGVLLSKDSVYYEVLRQWIEEGAVLDSDSQKVARIEVFPSKPVIALEGGWQQFRVVAHFPDGRSRDVTHEAFVESGDAEIVKGHAGSRVQAIRRGEAPVLVRYEGAYAAATVTVMGDRSGFEWQDPEIYNTIDALVSDKWQRMKIAPSSVAEDHEFLRRVRLDLTGLPPTVDELRTFLNDRRPSILKRMAKVDELIGSTDYVDHWTNKWADLLQVNSKFIGTDGAKAFREWIRKSVSENEPYDQFARDILTATGSNKDNPAASYYKILRDPDLIMENTTHLFLAVRFNCNKCHDHPFERWTQDQYYELAAYFAQTGLKKDPSSGDKRIGGTAVEGAKPLYEIVYDQDEGEMTHVRTNKPVPPAFPFDCDYETSDDASRREQLAAWITSKDNPYFAKSFVNRLWGYLTGTGLMEPLDDIRAGNPPTNPELMNYLTQEFIDSNFDVQHVLRLICNSRTYQLSVGTNNWNEDDAKNYSHAKARRLPAEVLYDAVYHVTGAVSKIPGVEPGTRAAALPDVAVQLPDGFLNNLGRPVRESACECERSQDLQLGPVMALVSGPTVGKAISDPQCALPALAEKELSDDEMVREIFLRVLNREASEAEVQGALQMADQIAVDHQNLLSQLSERENWWESEKSRLEEQRLADLQAVKEQIAAREKAIAPEREKMEQERQKKQKAAELAVAEYQKSLEQVANKYLDEHADNANWFPVLPESAVASNGDKLTPQPDRSIVASGKADKGVYTLRFQTPLKQITGFRLEALPMPGIKGGGPGLPENGNFVVTEIEVRSWQPSDENASPKNAKAVAIKRGIADFSQDGFAPEQVFDGNKGNQRGWAVSPRGGTVHWAAFQFGQPVNVSGDSMLELKIHQNHNAAQHRLAHFRISFTTDAGELNLGLPESFAALQQTAEADRAGSVSAPLVSYLKKNDKKTLELQTALADSKKPLPPDAELVGLQTKQKLLEVETPEDTKLLQLRADVAASEQQVQNRRLTLAQDLTWALINSPAFLFNR